MMLLVKSKSGGVNDQWSSPGTAACTFEQSVKEPAYQPGRRKCETFIELQKVYQQFWKLIKQPLSAKAETHSVSALFYLDNQARYFTVYNRRPVA